VVFRKLKLARITVKFIARILHVHKLTHQKKVARLTRTLSKESRSTAQRLMSNKCLKVVSLQYKTSVHTGQTANLTEIACVWVHPLALLVKQGYFAPGESVNLEGDDRIEKGSLI